MRHCISVASRIRVFTFVDVAIPKKLDGDSKKLVEELRDKLRN